MSMPKSKFKTVKNDVIPVIMSRKYHSYIRERAFYSNGKETIQQLIDRAVKTFYSLDDKGKVIKKAS